MKVRKTTFEEEQAEKEKWFQSLTPLERMQVMYEARKKMRKPGVNYSYEGMVVKVTRPSDPKPDEDILP